MSRNKSQLTKVYKYLFPQQGSDSVCHLCPITNRTILEELRQKNPDMSKIGDESYLPNDIWIGKTFKGIAGWQFAMNRLTNPQEGESTAFRDYQQHLLDNGIKLDKIYTAKGKKYYLDSWNPLKNLQRYWLAPYNFVNAEEHPEALQKALPLYSDGKHEYLFNPQTERYEKLKIFDINQDTYNIYLSATKKRYALTKEQKAYLKLPDGSHPFSRKMNSHPIFTVGYHYQFLPQQAKQNIYFHVGLSQLIFFALGLDNDHNTIDKNHPLYAAHQNFMDIMCEEPENPWVQSNFKKENFFEYHLAQVFKDNPELKEEAKLTGKCFFNTWEHYEKMDELYDSPDIHNRIKLSDKRDILPGEDQILAYSFSQSLRLIWSAAISQRSFFSVLELPKIIIPLTFMPGFSNDKKIIPAIYKKRVINKDLRIDASFIDTWKKVRETLLERVGDNKDLLSFDGHGAVISFSEDMNEALNNMYIKTRKVINDLGFSVIDSKYAKSVRPFYMKKEKFQFKKKKYPVRDMPIDLEIIEDRA